MNQIVIDGKPHDAAGLETPDREFREFWKEPVDGVIEIDIDAALPAYKARVRCDIETAADAAYHEGATSGDRMTATYAKKREQAAAVLASDQATIDGLDRKTQIRTFPTLAASVGIEAGTLWKAAQLVERNAQLGDLRLFQIETTRLTLIKAVKDAQTLDEVTTVHQSIDFDK